MASESPQAFVRTCIQKQKAGVIEMGEIFEEYLAWCRKQSLRPFTSKEFMAAAKNEIEVGYGIRPRHDLMGENGKARRGWSGLALKTAENLENQSALSE